MLGIPNCACDDTNINRSTILDQNGSKGGHCRPPLCRCESTEGLREYLIFHEAFLRVSPERIH